MVGGIDGGFGHRPLGVGSILDDQIAPGAFGPRVTDPVDLDSSQPAGAAPRHAASRRGEVIWIDRFGNLISGIAPDTGVAGFVVSVAGREVPFVTHYAEGPPDAPAALVNSDGLVEVFVNRGDAAALLGASIGAPVALIPLR